ncbi:MAG TPA: hypothetical protein VKY92_21070, partial [Verrucomicrobiae bacterium]|nr:hypothetical protein [Verrucomicrobiae bacterium]
MKNLRFALASAWLLACQAASAEPVSAAPTAVPVPAAAKVPQWPGVAPFSADSHNPSIRSGDVELVHSAEPLGGFLVKVSGHSMAVGSAPVLVGYVHEGRMRWMDCSTNSIRDGAVTGSQTLVTASFQCTDLDGGQWRFSRQFRAQGQPGAIDVQTEVTIDKDRAIAFLPMMVLFAGVGSFGQDKGQALLPGLEYLENEPSSSEADVIGPTANRLIPDSAKITFPLMALQADERYVALNWQMRPYLSALFDSPDRHFNSGGHVMGLMFPGCNGVDREEGSLLPRVAENVRAGNTIRLRATILGGNGETVVSAVQHFCGLHPLPSVPPAPELQAYVSQTAAGWLDSKIRQGTLVRHAVAEGGFPPQPAGDAAIWMEWLAQFDTQPSQVLRLRQTATNVLSAVPAAALNSAGVGHVRYPVESLVFGHVQETAELATQTASSLLSNFAPDGSLHYRSKPGGPDFSKTHYTNSASGYAAAAVSDLLVAASFSGQPDLIDAAIKELRTLSCFNNAVPRGAQTWECP